MDDLQKVAQLLTDKKRAVHIIGGGGVGMSALAMVLLAQGYTVSASDQNGGTYLDKLQSMGARVWEGSKPENIDNTAVVFISSAIPSSDPEYKSALSRGQEVFHRHPLLSFITSQYFTIAVSGTHGKTTTSGWVAFLLERAGLDPTAIIGGTLHDWGSNVRIGSGKYEGKPLLVIEADESDRSFLDIHTSIAIVTNMELDHVDNYRDEDLLIQNFNAFIDNTLAHGGSFLPTLEISRNYLGVGKLSANVENILKSMGIDEETHDITFKPQIEKIRFKVGLPGVHNLFNGSAVVMAGLLMGIDHKVIADTLKYYRGVARRMEVISYIRNSNGAIVKIIDDYAHHPTEIRAVLKTLQEKGETIVPVWEPHRVSRFIHFFKDFISVLDQYFKNRAIYLMNIYDAAGEKKMESYAHYHGLWSQCTENAIDILGVKNIESMVDQVRAYQKDTTILFLGAGFSSSLAHDLKNYLEKEFAPLEI